ncbi:MAG: glutathione S-transferase domain-containing protein [Actinomycetota bacterium]|nr:glutathione S-transferase domain-containing protein [Actinomycetota bacterium]
MHAHACGEAHQALVAAGHHPEVAHSYGLGRLPAAINNAFTGRREVKALTGRYWLPALVLDDGTAIGGSQPIIEWARGHPAALATAAAPVA